MFVSYAQPIRARCRHCDGEFELVELLIERDGRCPRCSTLLSPEWTYSLLENAEESQAAEEVFIKSLRRLVGLPGNVIMLPHSVLDTLWEEVGWEHPLAEIPGLLAEEVRLARLGLDGWERLERGTTRHAPARRLGGIVSHLRPSRAGER